MNTANLSKDKDRNKEGKSFSNPDYTTTVTILEHISDAFFILDAQSQIQYANRMALEILQIDLSELIHQPITQFLLLPEGPGNVWVPEPGSDVEAFLVNGRRRTPVVVGIGVVPNSEGGTQYVLVSAKDLSFRERLLAEERRQSEVAVSRDRLKALGEMSMGLVHELSQPLAGMRLAVELLQKKGTNQALSPKEVEAECSQLLQTVEAMTSIIQNARNFAMEVEDESLRLVDLRKCVDRAISRLSYELQERNIAVELTSDSYLPPVSANPVAIEQMVVGLIRMLWQNGSPKLSIELGAHGSKWVALRLHDFEERDLHDGEENGYWEVSGYDPLPGNERQAGELSALRSIVTGLGGDLKVWGLKELPFKIAMRIPADTGNERDQLQNLIEMLHQR